jgi:hypothetical protein
VLASEMDERDGTVCSPTGTAECTKGALGAPSFSGWMMDRGSQMLLLVLAACLTVLALDRPEEAAALLHGLEIVLIVLGI